MKRIIYPLFIFCLGAIGLYFYKAYVFIPFKEIVQTILSGLYLFLLGMSFNQKGNKKKNNIIKTIIVILFIITLLLQLDTFKIDFIAALVKTIGLDTLMYNAIYVMLGYVYIG